ncbi:MAG: Maff2 family protein [Clostridia bacterium]|nr:Maff2 family protein [Clostridia bacterium]
MDFRCVQGHLFKTKGDFSMEFFNSAVDVLKTLVVALGAGLGVWGAINLLEGYGNDNPGSKSQGMKQFMAN